MGKFKYFLFSLNLTIIVDMRIIIHCSLFVLCTCISILSYSTESKMLGLLESFDEIIKLHRKMDFQNKKLKLTQQVNLKSTISLDPQQILQIIFYSPFSYLKLSMKDRCLFYSFYDNNLLNAASSSFDRSVVRIDAKLALMKNTDLINYIFQKYCPFQIGLKKKYSYS